MWRPRLTTMYYSTLGTFLDPTLDMCGLIG